MASALVVIAVFVLHLIAFALTLAAEQRRTKGTEHRNTSGSGGVYCLYSGDADSVMVNVAMLILLTAQLITMVATRCLCCCSSGLRPGGSRACAIILFILSWVIFIVAEVFLMAATVNAVYLANKDAQQISCHTFKKTLYVAAAVLVVFNGILSEIYYLTYSRANAPPHYPGVRMNNM